MPKRTDIKSILVIGAGPIVIGQACEFDYSGVQACKALKDEGYRVILVNSNPATIMTDPGLADATYIEPITPDMVAKIIEKERPDAILPTMGGQTALNTAMALHRDGRLKKYKVDLIGANAEAIDKAEDRLLFREAMTKIGLHCPKSEVVHNREEAIGALDHVGLPAIIRPSFTLGGTGGGIAYNRDEYFDIVQGGVDASPVGEVLVEESVLGWKEYEMEVVRDRRDNCIIICSIENVDPMGIHTGDSVTVAPALTLTDKEYQIMRDASIACLREIGVDTGGSNVQFAVDPETGRMVVIEMNPRVSRSSALASKATGFPIAKVAARLAVGYTLDELLNDITGTTPASFEPTIDYVVTKMPRFAFEKFPGAEALLTTSMKSVGEAMSIGRTFQESLQKALRSMETGLTGLNEIEIKGAPDKSAIVGALSRPTPDRILTIAQAFRFGLSVDEVAHACKYEPWFLRQIEQLVTIEAEVRTKGLPKDAKSLLDLKKKGFSDERLAELTGQSAADVAGKRRSLGIKPVFKRIDTCAAEFESRTPYLYSCYEGDGVRPAECEAQPTDRRKVIILGGGPNRIGQGIEFDYCCVHAVYALREAGYETIMVNCNPETVSTDYDTADRLYFEPLTAEDVIELVEVERRSGELLGLIVQFGGQTPLKLAKPLEAAGIPILGTSPDAIDLAEDRERFQKLIHKLKLRQPDNGTATSQEKAIAVAEKIGYPVVIRPSYVLGGRAMQIVYDREGLERYTRDAVKVSGANPVLIDSYLRDAIEVDVDALADKDQNVFVAGIMEHIEEAGIHSGNFGLLAAAPFAAGQDPGRDRAPDRGDGPRAQGRGPDERAVRRQGRRGLCAGGQSARQPHGAVRRQGDRPADRQVCRPPDGRQIAEVARHQEGARQAHCGQGSGLPVRPLPGSRRHPGSRDALDRRGHGPRFRFRPRLRQVAARRRQQGAAGRGRVRVGQGPGQGPDGEAGEAAARSRLQGRGDRRHGRLPAQARHRSTAREQGAGGSSAHCRPDEGRQGAARLQHRRWGGGADRQLYAAARRLDAQDRLLYHRRRRQGVGRGHQGAERRGPRRGAPAILLQDHFLASNPHNLRKAT